MLPSKFNRDVGSTRAPSPLSEEMIFDVLSNSRRRFVVRYLREAGGSASITELATAMVAAETDVGPDAVSQNDHKRGYIALYQTHIPHLEERGTVTYDGDEGTVSLTETAEELIPYLEPRSASVRRPQLYVIIAIAGSGLALASILEAVPVELSLIALLGLLILLLVGVTD